MGFPDEEQDRSRWDHDQIGAALELRANAAPIRRPGPFPIQAAISAVHAQEAKASETNWRLIALLYARLMHLQPSPIIALNRAVAVRRSEGIAMGLALMDQISASGD